MLANKITPLCVSIVYALAFSSITNAAQVTIGFDGLASAGEFVGPITEDGFAYSLHSGGLTASVSNGNPAPELAGQLLVGGGTLSIVADTANADFFFIGVDVAEFDNNNVADSTITIEGFFSGASVGTETFTPTPSSGVGSYTSVFAASSLSGTTINELRIFLPSNGSNPFLSNARIDNVLLDNVAPVPLPPAVLLMVSGLFSFFGWRRWVAKT